MLGYMCEWDLGDDSEMREHCLNVYMLRGLHVCVVCVVCVVCTPIEYTLHRASSTGRAGWYARRRRGGARHAQAAVVPW